jgi:hypothetical protein
MSVLFIATLILLIIGIIILIRYDPKIDLISHGTGYTVLLWYNQGKERTYIRLFSYEL